MAGHVGIGRVDLGLVAAGSADSALQTIGDHHLGSAAEVIEGSNVGANPIGQLLRQSGFGESVRGGAPDRDKQLGLDQIAGLRIDQR